MTFTLYPHQEEGVAYLRGRHPSAFLAFEPRCGKTLTALSALPWPACPVVVVCPKSALGVWVDHFGQARPDYLVTTPKTFRWPAAGEAVVCNYERAVPTGRPATGTVLVYDEAQYLKHPGSRRTRRACVARNAVWQAGGKLWLLTGTPMENHPDNLWHLLDFAGLGLQTFGSRAAFVRLFGGESLPNGGLWWGQPRPEARGALSRCLLHKKKKDVLAWLPPVSREEVRVELDSDKARRLCDRFLAELEARGLSPDSLLEAPRVLGEKLVFELRRELALAKIPQALELVELAEEQGERMIVFSAHRAPVEAVAAREGWALITGDTSAAERTRICSDFRAGTLKGVACTIRAGRLAIDLSGATTVLFIDREWNPADNLQAEERASGPRQTEPVLIRNLVADHRVDRRLCFLLESKQRLINSVL